MIIRRTERKRVLGPLKPRFSNASQSHVKERNFFVVVRSESPLYSLSSVTFEMTPNPQNTSISDPFIISDHNLKRGGPGVCWLAGCSTPWRLASEFPIISDQSRAQIRSDQIRSLCRFLYIGRHTHTLLSHNHSLQHTGRQTLTHTHSEKPFKLWRKAHIRCISAEPQGIMGGEKGALSSQRPHVVTCWIYERFSQ